MSKICVISSSHLTKKYLQHLLTPRGYEFVSEVEKADLVIVDLVAMVSVPKTDAPVLGCQFAGVSDRHTDEGLCTEILIKPISTQRMLNTVRCFAPIHVLTEVTA